MNEIQYESMMENIEIGRHCMKCMQEILFSNPNAETLADLQECAYDYDGNGINIGFITYDGNVIWPGDPIARDLKSIGEVAAIEFVVYIDTEEHEGDIIVSIMHLMEIDDPKLAPAEFKTNLEKTSDMAKFLESEIQ